MEATSTIGNLPLLPAWPGFYPLLEGFARAAAETAITNAPTVVFITILLYPGTANGPGIMQQSGGEGRGADGQTDAQRDADQEADVEAQQAGKRKVGRGEEIKDISKSQQRAKAARKGIRTLEDALKDFGDD